VTGARRRRHRRRADRARDAEGVLRHPGGLRLGTEVGFALLFWADGSALSQHGADFGDDIYYRAGAFFSASTNLDPSGALGRMLQLAEAACGFAVLSVAIGHLPALYQAFSRREVAVSLDPRAGSPPTVRDAVAPVGRPRPLGRARRVPRRVGEMDADLLDTPGRRIREELAPVGLADAANAAAPLSRGGVTSRSVV